MKQSESRKKYINYNFLSKKKPKERFLSYDQFREMVLGVWPNARCHKADDNHFGAHNNQGSCVMSVYYDALEYSNHGEWCIALSMRDVLSHEIKAHTLVDATRKLSLFLEKLSAWQANLAQLVGV